jgi:signal transduction histidine kinase
VTLEAAPDAIVGVKPDGLIALAHDVNNELAAIVNYVGLVDEEIAAEIARHPSDESARLRAVLDDVSEIGAAAERAARLTQQLLAVGDTLDA